MAKVNEMESARRRGETLLAEAPVAVAAYYDPAWEKVVVKTNRNLILAFAPADAEGLESATPEQLSEIEITPAGLGLHFPRLDADLYVPALLQGVFGSRKWMAARLGEVGGRSKSPAKRAAAKANGALGGRPRKVAKSRTA